MNGNKNAILVAIPGRFPIQILNKYSAKIPKYKNCIFLNFALHGAIKTNESNL